MRATIQVICRLNILITTEIVNELQKNKYERRENETRFENKGFLG